ncbi:MAG: hypothetical protein K1000chlam2_01064 [Chlamydiae bacterium]|nr:hypothetical protein [Chlamydiota bacterium]
MVFIVGPRQVGKTTLSLAMKDEWEAVYYYNWDNQRDRAVILAGPDAVVENIGLEELREELPVIIFDEIHKYTHWKRFLKGLYDSYPNQAHIVVTGSARMEVFNAGGESLMGRYFPYRIHPLSIGEILRPDLHDAEIRENPLEIDQAAFDKLLTFGGFPDPYIKADNRFVQKWRSLRLKQLFEDDIRDLTKIREIDQLEVLAELLRHQVGNFISYESLAKKLQVNGKTVRNWLATLQALYYLFEIRPWTKNITRSLLKEPKYYLWDWALCHDTGALAENFIASHLHKAVHFWTDCGLGSYSLHYIRDKQKREVDFLVTKDNVPWFLVEVKNGNNRLISPHLHHFHEVLHTEHAFQVVLNMPYVDANCFAEKKPLIVPAKTFLSQLI